MLLLATKTPIVDALHFPGLISKDYKYEQALPIMSSYYLTTHGQSNIGHAISKEIPLLSKWSFAPRFPFSGTVDMCASDNKRTFESPIASYFGTSSKI